MSAPPVHSIFPPPPPGKAPALERTLRQLFLTLFLRGRTSRGLQKGAAPKSVGHKLALALLNYALFGLFAFFFLHQPVFALAIYLHAMSFVFLGLFVAASAGEVLFNKEEADILLHRPVTPRALLWAKISVIVQVSLWLAGAFNLTGLFVGLASPDGGWLFPVAHAGSTVLEALFCTACVVMVYQLCLRWFGRERLDGLMTAAQVLVGVAAVAGGQLVPPILARSGAGARLDVHASWIWLLPPAWFAAFDEAVAGRGGTGPWLLAAIGLAATAVVLWLALVKLARDYETGLRTLGEVAAPRSAHAQRRWIHVLVDAPPLRWWMGDSVARASFLLTAAYLCRDRDVKLRVYPSLAPMLVMPAVFLIQDQSTRSGASGFGIAFTGSYLGLIPFLGLHLLRYSQQWQAADLFRLAPLPGPAPLCHGARNAVLCFLTAPLLMAFGLIAWLVGRGSGHLALLLPGLIALPLYALIPCLGGKAVPLSLPTEESKPAGRGLTMLGVAIISGILSGFATEAWSAGWFKWLLLAEALLVAVLYPLLRASVTASRWTALLD